MLLHKLQRSGEKVSEAV